MSLSHHDEDYGNMRVEFIQILMLSANLSYEDAVEVWRELSSTMNDYGAVSWT